MKSLILLAGWFLVADAESDAQAAIAIAQANVKKPVVVQPKQTIDKSRPYVVFANTPEEPIGDIQTIRDDSYDAYGAFLVIKGKWHRLRDPQDAAFVIREVSRPALPFDPFAPSFKRKIAGLDGNQSVNGRWPTMSRLDGMTRYEPAELTQSIFKYVGNENGIIKGVSRSDTEPKYQVPGGLVGVRGWRSELYKSVPDGGTQYHALIGVTNSFNNIQHEAAFQRKYPEGAEFDDVLINTSTGKVFEHRIAMKVNGKWDRFIAYRDPSERPEGYIPPKSNECASCHSDAAKGKYGTGLPSGADEIFSDPFRDFPRLGEERQVNLR